MKILHTKKKVVISITVLLVLVVSLFFGVNFLRVKEVSVHGSHVLRDVDQYKGAFMPFMMLEKAQKNLYDKNAHVEELVIKRKYPNVLDIYVTEAEPIAYVMSTNGTVGINTAGRVFAKAQTTKVPLQDKLIPITFYQPVDYHELAIGSHIIHKEIEHSVFIAKRCREEGINIRSITISGSNMILFKTVDHQFIFTTEKSAQQQFEELSIVYSRLLQKGEQFVSLDLRFDKPIIKIQ